MTPYTIPTPEELKTMSTKTPRTDEYIEAHTWKDHYETTVQRSRQLETELLTALAENKALREALAHFTFTYDNSPPIGLVRNIGKSYEIAAKALTTPPPAVVWESQLREAEEDAERLAISLGRAEFKWRRHHNEGGEEPREDLKTIQNIEGERYREALEALAAHEGRSQK